VDVVVALASDGELTVGPMQLLLLAGNQVNAGSPVTGTPGDVVQIVDAWTLQLDGDPKVHDIDPGVGWEKQGFATYSGIGRYRAELELAAATSIDLLLPSVAGSATVSINGEPVGRRGWTPFVFHADATATVAGRNVIEIAVASSAANRYYAGTGYRDEPEPAGLLADPVIRLSGNEKKD
jgi:uncharacterized Zn-binding protein involved in type VI secretion